MKKTIPLLILLLLAVSSCQQQPLDFLRSMGVGVDSLMMDTIPQPYHMSGYMLTPEQYDQLFGEKRPISISREHSRITAIKPVNRNYLISIATYAYYESICLFSPQGKLLDGVYCGIWEGVEPPRRNEVIIKFAEPFGKAQCHCEFTSDTTFIIHSFWKYDGKAMTAQYKYQITGDKMVLLDKYYEEKPDSSTYEEICCGGLLTEAEESIFGDLIRRPLNDTMTNRVLVRHEKDWSEWSSVSSKTAMFYKQNPKMVLAWIDQHRNDSTEYISWSLMANCSRDKYLQEHLKQQLEQYPNPEPKAYMEQMAHKQATSK